MRKEKSNMDILFEALKAAREAFDKRIEKEGFDPAYWFLEPLVGHTLSIHDFKPMGRIVYDPDEGSLDDDAEVNNE